jgi:Protein of unknown function (DUF4235)
MEESMNGRNIAAKPVGLAAGAVGGKVLHSVWRRADHGRDVPEASDTTRSWRAVLLAAVVQGALFAVIHAVIERAIARPGRPDAPTG